MTTRFVCDGMLGTLCRLLRMCGFDAAYAARREKALIMALQEDRVLITRNTRLKGRDRVFFVDSGIPSEQLAIILRRFKLRPAARLFNRCLVCNEPLVRAAKEAVKKSVPYYTYRNFDEFARCPKCGRVYWKGSHYQKMKREVEAVISHPSPRT